MKHCQCSECLDLRYFNRELRTELETALDWIIEDGWCDRATDAWKMRARRLLGSER